MTRASIGKPTTSGTNASAALEIIAPQNKPCSVVSIDIRLTSATASKFGLGRPAAKGITPTTPTALLSQDGSAASVISTAVAVAWGTGPTVPTQFFRRVDLAATIGANRSWTFPNGLWIPAGGTLVLWNLGTNALAVINVVVLE